MACDVLRTDGCDDENSTSGKVVVAQLALRVCNLQLSWSYELNASHNPHFLSATLRKKNHVNINPAALPFESDKMRIDRSGGDGYAPLARRRRPENDNSAGAHGMGVFSYV